MTSNKQLSAAVRAYQRAHPGTSRTKAVFAVRAEHAAAPGHPGPEPGRPVGTAPAAAPPRATPTAPAPGAEYVGCRVRLTAARRRTLTGVVLPPAPDSRSRALRLAVDGAPAPRRFDPSGYAVTVLAGPHYRAGDLPAEHLATRTMLKAEDRRRPAVRQPAIADYEVRERGRRGVFDLYARFDAVAMRELPPAQLQAWNAARTCARCGAVQGRPIGPVSPEGERYCAGCHRVLKAERWARAAAPAQAAAAAWAAEVLADPRTVLVEAARVLNGTRIRAESAAGGLVLDAVVRYTDDLDAASWPGGWSPEQVEEHKRRYEGTVGPSSIIAEAERIAAGRALVYAGSSVPVLRDHRVLPSVPVPAADEIGIRFSIWLARACATHGYWYPAPDAETWHGAPSGALHEAYRAAGREQDAAGRIAVLRSILRTMAGAEPPTPSAD